MEKFQARQMRFLPFFEKHLLRIFQKSTPNILWKQKWLIKNQNENKIKKYYTSKRTKIIQHSHKLTHHHNMQLSSRGDKVFLSDTVMSKQLILEKHLNKTKIYFYFNKHLKISINTYKNYTTCCKRTRIFLHQVY